MIVVKDRSPEEVLASAEAGSAKHSVYHGTMLGNPAAFYSSTKEAVAHLYANPNTLFFYATPLKQSLKTTTALNLKDLTELSLAFAYQKDSGTLL